MKALLIALLTCLFALAPGGCTDDPIDRNTDLEINTGIDNTDLDNSGHNTRCTNSSPQPCPCNTTADCPSGFYCQPADSTPLYGYCWRLPDCNAGDPDCD